MNDKQSLSHPSDARPEDIDPNQVPRWTSTSLERRQRVQALLTLVNVTEPPVPIEEIARACDVIVRYVPFEGELSGLLYHENGQNIIGVNSLHSPTRQRFTIAHELGHLQLHQQSTLYLDRDFRPRRRDEESTTARNPEEVEANDFAAELLMPRAWIEHDMRDQMGSTVDIDYEHDDRLRVLAKSYQVSLQAMIFRLTNLSLLGSSMMEEQ